MDSGSRILDLAWHLAILMSRVLRAWIPDLGSSLILTVVAMMVAGRWDPTLAALRDTDWMCAPGRAPAHSVGYQSFQARCARPELKQGLKARTEGASVL